MFQLFDISRKTSENTRTANEYLKDSFIDKSYWIDSGYYQKWNYWIFDFSPNRNKKIRTNNSEVIGKEVWKERWKTISDTKIILLIEGIVQEIGGENVILLNWSIFYRRVRIQNLVGIDQEVRLERGITPSNSTEFVLNEGTIETLGWKSIILLNGSIFYRVDEREFDGLCSVKDDFLRSDQQDVKQHYGMDSYDIMGWHKEDQRIDSLYKAQNGRDEGLGQFIGILSSTEAKYIVQDSITFDRDSSLIDRDVHTISQTAQTSTHAMRHECTHVDFRIGSDTHDGCHNIFDQVEQSSPHSLHQNMVREEPRQSDTRNVSEVDTPAAALERIELVTFRSDATEADAFRHHRERARAEDSKQLQDPPAK